MRLFRSASGDWRDCSGSVASSRRTTDGHGASCCGIRHRDCTICARTLVPRHVSIRNFIPDSRTHNTDTANVNFLSRFGLTGLSAANVVAVTDSSKCAAAIVAYANLSEPANSAKRQALRTQLGDIAVYRLSANRYLLNAGIYNRYWTHAMFVTDSNFAYVSNYF